MKLCGSYEDHLGMITRVLGRENARNGEGVLPFIKACHSYKSENGVFSTWLWHNLLLHKKSLYSKTNEIKTIPLTECMDTPSHMDTAQIVESRQWLKKQVEKLSEDGRELVKCVLESQKPSKRKRTKYPTSNTASGTKIRMELKAHCRKTLEWSWPRYWAAVKEIKEMLKKLS